MTIRASWIARQTSSEGAASLFANDARRRHLTRACSKFSLALQTQEERIGERLQLCRVWKEICHASVVGRSLVNAVATFCAQRHNASVRHRARPAVEASHAGPAAHPLERDANLRARFRAGLTRLTGRWSAAPSRLRALLVPRKASAPNFRRTLHL